MLVAGFYRVSYYNLLNLLFTSLYLKHFGGLFVCLAVRVAPLFDAHGDYVLDLMLIEADSMFWHTLRLFM